MATTSKKNNRSEQTLVEEVILPRVKNPLNYHLFPKEEVERSHKKPHKALPDDTLTIEELVRRSMRGQPIPGQIRPGYYDEEDEQPDFARMDIAEQQEYLEARHDEAVKLRQKIKQEEEAKKNDFKSITNEIDTLRKQLKDLEAKQGPADK